MIYVFCFINQENYIGKMLLINTLTVSGTDTKLITSAKIFLGRIWQINIPVSADAACLDSWEKHPLTFPDYHQRVIESYFLAEIVENKTWRAKTTSCEGSGRNYGLKICLFIILRFLDVHFWKENPISRVRVAHSANGFLRARWK